MATGELRAIWLKRMSGGPMDSVASATLVAGRGLVGNANQGGRRQVTLIETELWNDIVDQLNANLDPSTRRANLLVSGIRLEGQRGRVLRIGDCRVRIYGETTPCRLMDEIFPGLQKALRAHWGGGAFGEVLDNGEIAVGDKIRWEEP